MEVKSISKETAEQFRAEAAAVEREEVEPRERKAVVRSLAKLIFRINQPGLSDYQLKSLNDRINHIIKGKAREHGFKLRNGKVIGGIRFDDQGAEIPGLLGYKYFGHAKGLAEVKELLEQPKEDNRSRAEISRSLTAEYYGFRALPQSVLEEEQKRTEELQAEMRNVNGQEDFGELYAAQFDYDKLPTMAEIEQELLARKKAEILSRYI